MAPPSKPHLPTGTSSKPSRASKSPSPKPTAIGLRHCVKEDSKSHRRLRLMSVIVVSHAQCQYSLQKWYMCISQRCRGHRAQLLHNQCRQICALYASVVDIQISFSELNFSRQAAIPLWCHRQNLTASSRCCTLPRMQKSCVEYFSQICVHVSRTMYADGDKVS
ncbi:hypothetical protein BGZ60DRAFT_125781 [Tricladium varicosporioides]|nr:hypothetical protein BGZ60DRAFT_125781 [Hymenoscyphus varicosporioides]